jgi:radical SAM protein with 4Fe4S-binding SPASM domain
MKLIPPIIKGPISIVHFITKKCNARCSHCFIDFDNPATFKGELTVGEIEKFTKSVGWQLQNVNITGGEPFLRRDIFSIAKCYLDNAHIKTMYITTNGFFTAFVKEFIELYLAAGYDRLLIFSLSIDDFPEKHDINRKVKGLFEKTIETYKTIQGFNHPKILANVNLTVIPANYKKMLDIYEYLVTEIGIKSFTTTIVREEGVMKIPVNLKADILSVYKQLNSRIDEDIRSKRIQGFQGGVIGRMMNAKNTVMHSVIEQTFMENTFVTPCYAGDLFLVLEANGDIKPCEVLENKELGNIRDYDYNLQKLWSAKKAEETRKWITSTKCRCTYECAASFNVLFNTKHIPALAKNLINIHSKPLFFGRSK